jgi:broad specificity phosphatase PhoE
MRAMTRSAMSLRLDLICHAATSATRRAAFPADESLTEQGMTAARALRDRLGRVDTAWCGPSARTRETAAALGLTATVEPLLRDWESGRWQGRSLAELQDEDPDAVAAWLADPAASPPCGEALLALLTRVGSWLEQLQDEGRRQVAVTHAAVVRAAVVHLLQAPPAAFWRIESGPLSQTILQRRGAQWTLRSVGQALLVR